MLPIDPRPARTAAIRAITCATCVHFAWAPEMDGPEHDAGGRPHHPSCSAVRPPAAAQGVSMGAGAIATTTRATRFGY